MKRFLGAMLGAFLLSSLVSPIRADEKGANAIVDKAIKAMGGEEKVKKAATATWKSKGVLTIEENDNEFTTQSTIQGSDKSRSEFEGEFGGTKIMVVSVLNGDKGWVKFGDMDSQEMPEEGLTDEKRRHYIQMATLTLLPLKSKAFKLETAPEAKVREKPAAVLKVTGPDGKDFKMFFDKESGLPVKVMARVVGFGPQRDEHDDETTYSDYKDFDGVKKATKTHVERDGKKFIVSELTEFKILDKVDPDKFAEPK